MQPSDGTIRPGHQTSVLRRLPYIAPPALVSIAGALLLAVAAAHHPFAPVWPAALVGIWVLTALLVPGWRVPLLIALLPVIDLAPFSGWIFIDDYDFVVLAAITLGYAALVRDRFHSTHRRGPVDAGIGAPLVAVYVIGLLVSATLGFNATESLQGEAVTPYFSRFNALRLLKAPVFALLLLPLASREARLRPAAFREECVRGILIALGLVCVSVLWERSAFGLITDLASEYRVTGLFSGTHTGGAAIDAFLAIASPFVLYGALRTTGFVRLGLLTLLALVAAYSILVTFSRALYAAVALTMAMQFALWAWHASRSRHASGSSPSTPVVLALPLLLAVIWLLEVGFSTGGYRGMAAMGGLAIATFAIGGLVPRLGVGLFVWLSVLAATTSAVALMLPKGVYYAFGLAGVVTLWSVTGSAARAAGAAWPGLLVLAVAAVSICIAWAPEGTPTGAAIAAAAGAVAAGIANTLSRQRLWRVTTVSLPMLLFCLIAGTAIVVVQHAWFATARLSTSREDFAGRLQHWSAVLAARKVDGIHTVFGNGLGRVPDALFWGNDTADLPGVYTIEKEMDNHFLRLHGSRYRVGYGDPLRVMQAMHIDAPRVNVSFRYRNPGTRAMLSVNFCARHLIYGFDCRGAGIPLPADNAWHTHTMAIDVSNHAFRDAFPPRPVFITFETDTQKAVIDIDDVTVAGLGRELANGGFEHGMDRWFFTSDRIHLAWHAKNLFLHVLLEQGLLGLVLLLVLAGMALWRLLRAAIRGSPLAAAALAALSGFLCVGMFDSLLDVPRIALLFYLPLFAWCMGRSKVPMSGGAGRLDGGLLGAQGPHRGAHSHRPEASRSAA